jgi:hypothetical protein
MPIDSQPRFTWGVRRGEPIAIPGGSATPRALHVAVRLPHVVYVWNTPLGIDLQRGERTERVPAIDVTRLALVLLGLFTLLTGTATIRRMLQKEIAR